MNILTKNRILEAGDEWKGEDGKWRPVHTKHIGLQVMFSEYKEVRRPTEAPSKVAAPKPKAEEPKPAPITKPKPGTVGEASVKVLKEFVERERAAEAAAIAAIADHAVAHLPTVISKKAHKKPGSLRESAIEPEGATPAVAIPYTELKAHPLWIGRNGTFHATGVNLARKSNVVQIRPMGKRGLAKNALIEIPMKDIGKVADWLKGQIKNGDAE